MSLRSYLPMKRVGKRGLTRAQLLRQIEDAEAARADALHPAFHRAPRVDEAKQHEERIGDLHREVDGLDAKGRAR